MLADAFIGNHNQRLFGDPLSECWQRRVALDLGIERLHLRVAGEFHGAAGSRFIFSQIELLRKRARSHALHIGLGDGRTGRKSAPCNQTCRCNAQQHGCYSLRHNKLPDVFLSGLHRPAR